MKLVTFRSQGKTRLGAVSAGQIVDLAAAATRYAAATSQTVETAHFQSMAGLLSAPSSALQDAEKVVGWAPQNAPDLMLDLESSELDLPLANPGKIICIGLNYADHCRETGAKEPQAPLVFCKFTTSLLPHGGAITWSPHMTQKVDYEAELAVIIGRKAFRVPEEEAMEYVAGYTIVNDISARDVQNSDEQWVRGKSFDTFCPMGPFVVTADAIADPHALDIRCRVNGVTLQDSNTREMIFKIPTLVSYISHSSTLMPGDIISTGTPHGVGIGYDPPVLLKPGDTVEVEIEEIGILINFVV